MKRLTDFKNEHDLQLDLAEFLRNSGLLTFTEIQIRSLDSCRADVIAVSPSLYSNKDIRIYEVKLTREAWLSDRKFQKYLQCCNRLYIACPKGLIKKEELPLEVGLITRSDTGWHVVKSPRLNINPPKIDVDFVFSLLYRGYEENRTQRVLRDKIIADSNASLSKQAAMVGADIARRLDNSKDGQIESWCNELWNLFDELGINKPKTIFSRWDSYKTKVYLPDIDEIRELLCGTDALLNELATIKAIGNYLKNIELPETSERLRSNRVKALAMISGD